MTKSDASARQESAAARRTHISRVRAAVRHQLAQSYRRRREVSRALADLRDSLNEMRNEVRVRLRTLSQKATPLSVKPAPVPGHAPADRELSADVLRVIVTRPDGIAARDIGNELGVDWRCVPPIARELVDLGAVEEIEQEFYPAGKAMLK